MLMSKASGSVPARDQRGEGGGGRTDRAVRRELLVGILALGLDPLDGALEDALADVGELVLAEDALRALERVLGVRIAQVARGLLGVLLAESGMDDRLQASADVVERLTRLAQAQELQGVS